MLSINAIPATNLSLNLELVIPIFPVTSNTSMRIRLQPNTNRNTKKASDRFKSFPDHFKTQAVFAWLLCDVLCSQPFCFVEIPVYRRYFKQYFILRKPFIKYLQLLTELAEGKVKEMLLDKFSVFFDGWSGVGTQYVPLFGSFSSDNPNGYEKYYLVFLKWKTKQHTTPTITMTLSHLFYPCLENKLKTSSH